MPKSTSDERNLFILIESEKPASIEDDVHIEEDQLTNQEHLISLNLQARALADIATLLAPGIASKFNKSLNQSQNQTEVKILFNTKMAGKVIGAGARNIKALKKNHNCDVTCFRDVMRNSKDRIVQIVGKQEGM